jgi:hypothetical protein
VRPFIDPDTGEIFYEPEDQSLLQCDIVRTFVVGHWLSILEYEDLEDLAADFKEKYPREKVKQLRGLKRDS